MNSTVPSSSGTAASPASRAMLRRRPKTSRSSLRSSRPHAPRRGVASAGGVAGPTTPATTASARDIEALPGECDEELLEARPSDLEPEQVDPGMDERCRDALGGDVREQTGQRHAVDGHLGDLSSDEYLGSGRQ